MYKYNKLFGIVFLVTNILTGLIITNKINLNRQMAWSVYIIQVISLIGYTYSINMNAKYKLMLIIPLSICAALILFFGILKIYL